MNVLRKHMQRSTSTTSSHGGKQQSKTGRKPVSAMKGSREKPGATQSQNLVVKWAPDVYDPVPTSVSHTVTNDIKRQRSKKNPKSEQMNENKSSSESKYKDMIQGRNRGDNCTAASFKPPEQEEELVVYYDVPPPSAKDVDVDNPVQFFDVDNPDQFFDAWEEEEELVVYYDVPPPSSMEVNVDDSDQFFDAWEELSEEIWHELAPLKNR